MRMTISAKQRLILASSSVLIGCAVGATMPTLNAQSFVPNQAEQQWEQACEDTEGNDLESTNTTLTWRGRAGFELVSTTVVGSHVWHCFKKAAPR